MADEAVRGMGRTFGGRPLRGKLARILIGMTVCAAIAAVGGSTVGANRTAERTISLYNIHTKETVAVVYKRDGRYVPAAMERVNWVLRDWRKNEPTTMDPALVDLLWEIHNELGSREPIHVISGFRSRGTNSMLKKTRGGQADNSQHIQGKAADVHFPDVPVQRLRYSALVRERGGVGYYPTSALPFVHVDTARVRAWPRLPRTELALLFPSGRTQHLPADGGPLTSDDARSARVRLASAGGEMAAFLNLRRGGGSAATVVAEARPTPQPAFSRARPPVQSSWQSETIRPPLPSPTPVLAEVPRIVASGPVLPSAAPAKDRARMQELASLASAFPEPRLVTGPRPAVRPLRDATIASLAGRSAPPAPDAIGAHIRREEGHQVAAIDAAGWTGTGDERASTGRFGWGATGHELHWVPAAEFDDEHPDELSYRPFAIGPLLTDRADEPLLATLVAHDVARTFEMIDQPVSNLPLRFRPSAQVAAMMWSQRFSGSAVGLDRLLEPAPPAASPTRPRAVQTTSR
jgi:uncharacterized protein YcbK (DUF882 family)